MSKFPVKKKEVIIAKYIKKTSFAMTHMGIFFFKFVSSSQMRSFPHLEAAYTFKELCQKD